MKILFIVMLLFGILSFPLLNSLKAQNSTIVEDIGKTYQVAKDGNYPDLGDYITALNKATLDNYRLKSTNYIMNFENGLQIEILSADNLVEKGLIKSSEAYPLSFAEERIKAVFNLKDGYILEFRAVLNSRKAYRNNSEK